ncbi:MAG: proline dehydrogenase family protein [Bryobacterales bacterium]|nr:proline dehydrogenase family protein [Bryobacteraceae bacterium]MDW8130965.1 proline dehydrogenase family protein [Bryobacterales bacterium]
MLARTVLLFLSRRRRLRRWVETSALARRLTSRFVAGLKLDDALAVCRRLNELGLLVTLDCLGENVTSAAEVEAARNAYLAALDSIEELGLRATVSLKLSQFGLDFSEELCYRCVEEVVRRAAAVPTSVEVDMESLEYVDRTLALVVRMHQAHGNVRGVIQAYLRRSRDDLEMLCERGIPVRLCKGAYREPASVAYQTRAEIRASFLSLADLLLDRGVYPGFATHDEFLIGRIRQHAREAGVPATGYEFQMLYGVRRDLERKFLEDGLRLRLYVPYGEAWYPYFMRRLAEHPANLVLLLRNLFRS